MRCAGPLPWNPTAVSLTFEAVDTRSLSNDDGCEVRCAEIKATVLTGPGGAEGTDLPVDDAGTDQLTDQDFFVSNSILEEGDYVIEIVVPHNALGCSLTTRVFEGLTGTKPLGYTFSNPQHVH